MFLIYTIYMNKRQNTKEILNELGFSKNEAKIYTSVLKLGSANVTDIARESKLNRTALYIYLDALLKADFLQKTFKGKRIYYIAQNPKKIITNIERKKRKALEVLPLLTSLYQSSSKKPVMKFYEGKEGMRSIYREMTKTPKRLWSIFSADRYYSVFSEKDGQEFFSNIFNSGGELRDLVKNTKEGRHYVKNNIVGDIGKSKLLPKNFIFEVDLMISGTKVSMISLSNLIGVVIENKEMADLQRNFLKFIWEKS